MVNNSESPEARDSQHFYKEFGYSINANCPEISWDSPTSNCAVPLILAGSRNHSINLEVLSSIRVLGGNVATSGQFPHLYGWKHQKYGHDLGKITWPKGGRVKCGAWGGSGTAQKVGMLSVGLGVTVGLPRRWAC